jgi:hypothetical protein
VPDFGTLPWLPVQQAAMALEMAGLPSQGHGLGIGVLSRILWRSPRFEDRCEAIRLTTIKAAQLN